MIELRFEKVISIICLFVLFSCQKRVNESNEVEFLNKDFEEKLHYFITKSDSLQIKNANKEFILVYLQDMIIESVPQKEECAIIFYATPPFGCENYKFGTIINGKKVLFYDDSDCLNFNEFINFKSQFECSDFFIGEDHEIDSAIELYFKYENGKLLMRD